MLGTIKNVCLNIHSSRYQKSPDKLFRLPSSPHHTSPSSSSSSLFQMAPAAAAAETLLKTGQVSAMIKQGFFSPSSPPPLSPPNPISSPNYSPTSKTLTLFQMISQESQSQSQSQSNPQTPIPTPTHPVPPDLSLKRIRVQDRILSGEKPNWGPGDVELLISSVDGVRVSMEVHRRVLAAKSSFFKENLGKNGGVVEISECDDVEVYVEVVAMMYCGDLRRRLAGEEIGRVLGLLKVSAAIMFDAGVVGCLEYLEAIPWSEDQEEEVVSVLNNLQLHESVAEVLKRVLVEPSTSSRADAIFLQLLGGVLHAKDEKARRDMKALISGLLREDTNQDNNNADRLDVSRKTLYRLCHKCLNSLHFCLSEAVTTDESRRDRGNLMGEIAREADNVHWLVEILINKKLADEFVTLWADQNQLASLHPKIPCMYRFEISRITAQLCVAIGKGEILVSKDARFSLLQTWLEAVYNDFAWMKRACRNLNKSMVEDGLCKTILTLSMAQQQTILMRWFDRFLKKGDDCPNLQRAFEVWWRRTFVRTYGRGWDQSELQISVCDYRT